MPAHTYGAPWRALRSSLRPVLDDAAEPAALAGAAVNGQRYWVDVVGSCTPTPTTTTTSAGVGLRTSCMLNDLSDVAIFATARHHRSPGHPGLGRVKIVVKSGARSLYNCGGVDGRRWRHTVGLLASICMQLVDEVAAIIVVHLEGQGTGLPRHASKHTVRGCAAGPSLTQGCGRYTVLDVESRAGQWWRSWCRRRG